MILYIKTLFFIGGNMYNFTWNIPTVIHFGKDQLSHLEELKESGNKVLMVYGGGSINLFSI